MNIDDQREYWNRVADIKTFTHSINFHVFENVVNTDSRILDYGCGYGRIVKQLLDLGFSNVIGVDTSRELINRGKRSSDLPIYCIDNPVEIPVENNSVDCILLFAVLTCIPSNKGQTELIKILHSKLIDGGVLYISDYYLQPSSDEVNRYNYLNDEEDNYGVFTLPEGAIFRHHTREWIQNLVSDFSIVFENKIEVKTMNGSTAEAFQLLLRK